MHVKKGDTVQIIAGKDRGKTGKVLRVVPKQDRVVVEGINLYKKHVRPRREGEKGEIVDVSRPLHASNVKLVCQNCGRAVRTGAAVERNEDGRVFTKRRVCKECGAAT